MMRNSDRLLLAIATLGLLVIALSAIGNRPVVAEAPKPVEVVNNPLVQAQQAGSWNVGINGQIQVGNAVTNPVPVRDVDHPVRQPVFFNCVATGDVACDLFTVPNGKMLVIEMFSGTIHLLGPGRLLSARVIVDSPNAQFLRNTFAVPVSTGPDASGNPAFVFSQPVRVYAEEGSTVTGSASVVPVFGQVSAGYSVSGYLVDCGPARIGQIGCPVP